jgi:uncharacterized protein (TIGR03067 family)
LTILDVAAVMAEDSAAKLGLWAAVIGAFGAITAAIVPIYFSRPAPDPAPAATKAEASPGPAVNPAPVEAKPAPADAKSTRDTLPTAVASVPSNSGASAPIGGPIPDGSANLSSKAGNKTVPKDLARLQGIWEAVEVTNQVKSQNKAARARTNPTWTFDGNKLTIRHRQTVFIDGSFTVDDNASPKSIDLTGKRQGENCELLGIYAFEGPELVIRYRVRVDTDAGQSRRRPDSFKLEPAAGSGMLVRLRRAGE